MKPGCLSVAVLTLLAALGSALAVGLFTPAAGDEETADPGAEALKKAVETGKTLFHDVEFGTNGRACAKCHENPRKPEMNLKTRVGNYPKWDRREGKVITLGQKLNQMLQKMLKGQAEPLGSEKLVAVEAYLMSLSRQVD